uniref:DUF148 domain-containing protein n=1 Tax=Caenorhabditis tropicalis TaxID=1561998 RepID=A0A1I7U947_9PELO
MFKQLYIFLAVSLLLVEAGRPFPVDKKQAIQDMVSAGIELKTAEALFTNESRLNRDVAKANDNKVKVERLMDWYGKKKEKILKKLSKEQLDKVNKFFQ